MQAVDRVIKLLELLSEYSDGLGINDISERVDLPLSTSHRILKALKKKGYVVQDNITKRYRLGMEILTLAINLLNNIDITKIANPVIEELSTKQGQLIFLSVIEDDNIICVDMANNSRQAKLYVQIGYSMPPYCSAAAKAIVAFLDEEEIDNILDKRDRIKYTQHTKLDTAEIRKELSTIRHLGYAICDEEMYVGVKAFSVPIYRRDGRACASITTMLIDQTEYDEEYIIQDLEYAADKISKSLGYRGHEDID